MNIDKIIFLSDLHFGAHSNNMEWFEMMKDYFENFFIPNINKNNSKIALFILGDIFDNRQYLNIKIMNDVLDIFLKISKICPIHIITGNHDTFFKNTNEINSLKIFSNLNNIFVYEKPTVITLKNNKKILLMPWQINKESEEKIINTYQADYLFCHTEFYGAYQNHLNQSTQGIDCSLSDNYLKIYTGHIHYRQDINNLHIIGSPYEITRSDSNNKKGFYILDTNTNEHEFIENNRSPKFIKLLLLDILDMNVYGFKKIIRNNYVDIICDNKYIDIFPFYKLLELTETLSKKINIITKDNIDIEIDDFSNNYDNTEFNLMQLTENYIKELPYSLKIQSLLKKKINELYQRVLVNDQEDILNEN